MNFQKLLDRIKKLLVTPKPAWEEIALEQTTPKDLLIGLILPLAAIGPVAALLGWLFHGFGFGFAFVFLLIHYLVSVGVVFLVAFLADVLAPTFGGEKNFVQSLKLAAYTSVPYWLAGALAIIPLSFIAWIPLAVGLIYGVYLLHVGLPILKKPAPEKTMPYFIAMIVTWIIAGAIVKEVPFRLALRFYSPSIPSLTSEQERALKQGTKMMEEMNKRMEEAAKKAAEGR